MKDSQSRFHGPYIPLNAWHALGAQEAQDLVLLIALGHVVTWLWGPKRFPLGPQIGHSPVTFDRPILPTP